MTNEAVIIELIESGVPIRYTVADGTGIAKGTLLKITDPRTAVATSADNDPFAGIASSEKVASDGSTYLDAYTKGIFDLKTDGNITAGGRVSIKAANTVAQVAAADLLFSNVGICLETAADGEVCAVFVGQL